MEFVLFQSKFYKICFKGGINNNPSLVENMAWHQIGDKPLSEAMVDFFADAYYVSLSFNEWKENQYIKSKRFDFFICWL